MAVSKAIWLYRTPDTEPTGKNPTMSAIVGAPYNALNGPCGNVGIVLVLG